MTKDVIRVFCQQYKREATSIWTTSYVYLEPNHGFIQHFGSKIAFLLHSHTHTLGKVSAEKFRFCLHAACCWFCFMLSNFLSRERWFMVTGKAVLLLLKFTMCNKADVSN